MIQPRFVLAALLTVSFTSSSCGRLNSGDDSIGELAQQVGDTMASMDEAGGSTGSIAWNGGIDEDRILKDSRKLFARHGQNLDNQSTLKTLIPSAHAATCLAQPGFGSCSSNTIIRNFNGCTVGAASLTGTVTLTWAGTGATSCLMNQTGNTITRVPNFTVTGLRGATLEVYGSGSIGQRLTWSSGSGSSKVLSFSNDGIRRKFTSNGTTLLDFTTETTSNITVTGSTRSSRVLSGGVLRTTNNLNSVTCDFTPTSVSWSSTCNCATSGSWSATCSDGNNGNVTLTGCGSGTYTFGTTSGSVTFDRCYSTI